MRSSGDAVRALRFLFYIFFDSTPFCHHFVTYDKRFVEEYKKNSYCKKCCIFRMSEKGIAQTSDPFFTLGVKNDVALRKVLHF